MTGRELRKRKVVSLFKALGMPKAKVEEMTEEEACREYSRIERMTWSRGVPMGPAELQRVGLQRHRARNTHRGKR